LIQLIAEDTGGKFFKAPTSTDLEYIYVQITQRIQQQYIITFTDNTGITSGILTVKVNYNQMYGEDSKEYKTEVIGEKYWGSIGTVISGPVEADGHIWYEVKWDNDENVPGETGSHYKPESGWSKADFLWEYDVNERARGLDVSHWNTIIDWETIYNSGREFVFIKATDGYGGNPSLHLNYLNTNAPLAKEAGLEVGIYHFAEPVLNPTETGAREEADWFVKKANKYLTEDYLRPALDIERGKIEEYDDCKKLASWVNAWMEKVKEEANLATYPILYCNQEYAKALLRGDSTITKYSLWIVDLSNDEIPDNCGWSDWAFRQYAGAEDSEWAGRARCPGFAINAGVDLNIYSGDIEDLKSNFLIK
jgi:GH25 family lysozyme M1 (1,4-beta-N-acetylmuramidase)